MEWIDRACRQFHEDRENWRPVHNTIGKQLDFALKLDHYEDDSGSGMWPRGRELLQLLDHRRGLITRAEIMIDCLPVDETHDPDLAEVAKHAVRDELLNPSKRFRQAYDRAIMGALAARIWGIRVDLKPEASEFGEIVHTSLDGRCMMWSEGFDSPHDPCCPRFTEFGEMTVGQVRAMKYDPAEGGWNVPDDLVGDGEVAHDRSGTQVQFMGGAEMRSSDPDNSRLIVGKLWERYVQDTDDNGHLKYPGGKRLTIIAPNKKLILWQGPWPWGLRVLPYFIWQSNPHPSEQVGQSETSTNATMQIASNVLMRLGLQHMLWSKPYTFLPRIGHLETAEGDPFTFSESDGIVGYYTGDLPPQGVISVQGAGLPAAWNILHQAVQGVFRANMGATDLGLTPTQSRDIAVGTVKALVESGEIPVDHQIEMARLEMAPYLTAVYTLIRAMPRKLMRMHAGDGEWMAFMIAPQALPDLDLIMVADPALQKMNQADLNTFSEFAALPKPWRRFAAKRMGIAPADVTALEQDEAMDADFQTQQMAAHMGGMGNRGMLPTSMQRKAGGSTYGSGAAA